jgi:hypothetical protein
MTCGNCDHGRSWHIQIRKASNLSGVFWHEIRGHCRHEGCSCRGFRHKYKTEDDEATYFKPEQVQKLEELKKQHDPQIIVDKQFHEMFCQVLKEETNRECDCLGTTNEVRPQKK